MSKPVTKKDGEMIITDRNEAFKHNSCKKLAQLGKVIFTMSAQARDRQDELASIQNKYESLIMDIVEKHQENAEEIAKALVQFRKGCVDSSCRQWGSMYKQIKLDLANLYNNQNQKIADLLTETQGLAKSIKAVQMMSLKAASNALDAADELQKDLKVKTRPTTTSRRTIRENIRPILEKIEAFNAESEQRLREIRSEHAKEISKNRAEITKFLQEELSKRRGPFMKIRGELTVLEQDVKTMRQEYQTAVKERNDMMKESKSRRNVLVSETKEQCKKIRQEIKAGKDQEKLRHKAHADEVSDLVHSFELTKKNHKAEIDALRQQIHSQKRQRKKYAEAHDTDMKKRAADDIATEENMKKKTRAEIKRRNEQHALIAQNIAECETDMSRLIELLQEGINGSVERLNNRLLVVRNKIKQQEADEEVRLEEQKVEFQKRGKERLDVLESAIEAQKANDEKAVKHQKHDIRKLTKELQAIKEENERVVGEAEAKFKADEEEARKHNESRLDTKKSELNAAVDRKVNEKTRRINDIKKNFNKDLDAKKDSLQKEYDEKVEEERSKWHSQCTLEKEEQNANLQLTKTKAKCDVADKQIQQAKVEHDKKVSHLQNEIANLEKQKRQHERWRKTETSTIDEEYERRIQVEQVNLGKAVDNIAKLYDADENQRGCDIIEAIRKVRETNNHTDDFLTRKRHDFDTLKNTNDKTISELKKEIEKYQTNAYESELTQKITNIETQTESALSAANDLRTKDIAAIQKSIEQQKQENSKSLDAITAQINAENQSYNSKSTEITAEKAKVEQSVASDKAKCDAEYNQKRDKLEKDHALAIQRMQARIDSAKKLHEEMATKYREAKEKQIQANQSEIEQRSAENVSMNANLFGDVQKKSEELSDKITELSKKQTDVELQFMDPASRRADKKKMETLQNKIHGLDETQESSFDGFYTMVRNAPLQAAEIEIPPANSPAPMSSHGSRSNSSANLPTTSRSSRRDSRLVTPLESRNRKRGPQVLISPQYA